MCEQTTFLFHYSLGALLHEHKKKKKTALFKGFQGRRVKQCLTPQLETQTALSLWAHINKARFHYGPDSII